MKFDGVQLQSNEISQLADGNPCCTCEASHATSFAVVNSSANAAVLINTYQF